MQKDKTTVSAPSKRFKGKIGNRMTFIVIICLMISIYIIAAIAIQEARMLTGDLLLKNCTASVNVLQQQLGTDVDLHTDYTAMLDSLKESTGCELTIFSGDTRTSTTILKDGKRAIGTTLDSNLAEIILNQKQNYNGEADILGAPHICSYIPVIKDGKAVGLLFAGVSKAEVNHVLNRVVVYVVCAGFVLLALSSIAIYLFSTFCISRPLGKVTNLAKEIENGNLGISSGNIITADTHSNTEIGLLSYTFESTFTRLRDYIKEISYFLGLLSEKDLQADIKLNYVGDFVNIKESLEKISESLNETMNQIQFASNDVSGGSFQVSQAAQSLSGGAAQQASAIEQLSSALTNISEHVNQNSQKAKEAQEKAIIIDQFIKDTNEQMKQMVSAMEQISLSSNEIAKIDQTIEDISFQTNLLALNASVEASHAGEAGKGFAVVANEVRSLASKSSDASKDTAIHIEQALEAIQNGIELANATMESTTKATDSIDEIVDLVTAISDATSEQAASIQQFSSAVKDISSVVHANSSTAEESASAIEELSSRANALLDMVDTFKLKK